MIYKNVIMSCLLHMRTYFNATFMTTLTVPARHRDSPEIGEKSILFDFHRAVHRNIIPIVKPTRCTSVVNLFYFRMTLYMFRTVFPSIIRSSRLYIQQQAFVKQILLSACQQADSSICLTNACCHMYSMYCCLTNACCCMFSLELLMMDGKTVRIMYSVFQNKINLIHWCIQLVLLQK